MIVDILLSQFHYQGGGGALGGEITEVTIGITYRCDVTFALCRVRVNVCVGGHNEQRPLPVSNSLQSIVHTGSCEPANSALPRAKSGMADLRKLWSQAGE